MFYFLGNQEAMNSEVFGRGLGRKGAIMSKFINDQLQGDEMRLIDTTYRISTGLSFDFNMNETPKHKENELIICVDQEISRPQSDNEVLVISSEEDEKPQNYECPECDYETSQYGLFNTHLRLHTSGKAHECDICSKQFAFSVSLTHHKKLHKFTNIFRCSACRNGFDYEEDFLKHEPICKRDLFACGSCEYTTKREVLMNTHRRTHLRSKPYQCYRCFKAFSKKNFLDKHIQAHLDDHSKYLDEIEIREKKYYKKDQLILNMATNGNKFPFECTKCKLPFSEEYDKRAHEELCQRKQYKHLWNFSNVRINNVNRPPRSDEPLSKKLCTENDSESDIEIVDDQKFHEPKNQQESTEVLWRPWI